MEILRVDKLNKEFRTSGAFFSGRKGTLRALDNVSFYLEKGKVLGVIGESGSGKTTLARVICRLMEPDSGEIIIKGRKLKEYPRKELSKKVQLIFQDPFSSLNPKLTIGTILHEAIDRKSATSGEKVGEMLKTVGMPEDILSSYPHQFSGGQRQRIAIARALLKNPEIIIADEPLSSLDISIQTGILDLFKELKEKFALTFIFISHDIVTTAIFSDYVIVMKNGKIVENNTPENIIKHPENVYTQKLVSAVPKIS